MINCKLEFRMSNFFYRFKIVYSNDIRHSYLEFFLYQIISNFHIIDKLNFSMRYLFPMILLIVLLSCSKDNSSKDKSNKTKKEKNVMDSNSLLAKYELASEKPVAISLPKDLLEISGITMTPDGRLFAQQDEKAIIYEVDMNNGSIIKRFSLGNPPRKEDFEDIAYANGKFYLLKSTGDIYEFVEGADGQNVEYKVYQTELKHSNDVEGMCYDPETNSLILACKGISGTGDYEDKAIYSFSLDSMKLNLTPRFLIKTDELKKSFNPSGIERNSGTGTFFVIAANGNEIIELTKEGKIIGRHELPQTVHAQPEGITFAKDGRMLISNEGKSGKGYIVVYPKVK